MTKHAHRSSRARENAREETPTVAPKRDHKADTYHTRASTGETQDMLPGLLRNEMSMIHDIYNNPLDAGERDEVLSGDGLVLFSSTSF